LRRPRSPCRCSSLGCARRWRRPRSPCIGSSLGCARRWRRPRSPGIGSSLGCARRWRLPHTHHKLTHQNVSHRNRYRVRGRYRSGTGRLQSPKSVASARWSCIRARGVPAPPFCRSTPTHLLRRPMLSSDCTGLPHSCLPCNRGNQTARFGPSVVSISASVPALPGEFPWVVVIKWMHGAKRPEFRAE